MSDTSLNTEFASENSVKVFVYYNFTLFWYNKFKEFDIGKLR